MQSTINPVKFKPFQWNIRGELLTFYQPLVMGILNVTSDSFFDGGKYDDVNRATAHARMMIDQGADIIDIGASSSRPGSIPVAEQDELETIRTTIESIRAENPNILISVDTFRATVARLAIEVGADVINDISAGDDDESMVQTVADLKVPYIAMHKKGSTQNMQKKPVYDDVVTEVLHYFDQKLNAYKEAGINDIVIDPGFGFGKSVRHNYQLMRALNSFQAITKCAVLIGVSRKSMINRLLKIKPEEALNATTSLNTIGLLNGASILRVHDVAEAVQVRSLVNAVLNPEQLDD